MKKIIGFFDSTACEELPALIQLSVVYEEDGKYFIQYQLSKQFFALTTIVCDLKKQEDIEREVQAYLSQGVSGINERFGNYTNNDDITGNRYYFKEVGEEILTSPSFYPIKQFNVYMDDDIKITERNPIYAFIVDGTEAFVGNRNYIYNQVEMLFEYPTSDTECDFKINLLYDLEKYDKLSDEVDYSSEHFKSSSYQADWQKKKEEGQVLKFVYQKIKHNC